jgi:hypothetical protein
VDQADIRRRGQVVLAPALGLVLGLVLALAGVGVAADDVIADDVVAAWTVVVPGWLAELEQPARHNAAASTAPIAGRRTCVIRIRIADFPQFRPKPHYEPMRPREKARRSFN